MHVTETVYYYVYIMCVLVLHVFPSAEFPTPKTELVQRFQVLYLGMMPVAKPIGASGQETLFQTYTV